MASQRSSSLLIERLVLIGVMCVLIALLLFLRCQITCSLASSFRTCNRNPSLLKATLNWASAVINLALRPGKVFPVRFDGIVTVVGQ